MGLHRRSARDFLDALAALGFLERQDGIYSNTPVTDLYLDKKNDAIIDDDRRKNAFGLMMSLHMMIETHGRFDYIGADCLDGCTMRDSGRLVWSISLAPTR